MKNRVSISLSLMLTIAGTYTASAQAQTRPTANRLPQVTTHTTPVPRNPAPANSSGTPKQSGCFVSRGDGLPTQVDCPGSAGGTSTSDNTNIGTASGSANSPSLCAEVLSGRLKVTGPLSCFGEGANPQALAPAGSPNAHLPQSYVNSFTPGFAPSTQPGVTSGAGGVQGIEASPVIGADTFVDAGRDSQGGSCNDLNSSMDALINNSGSGGSSPNGQCMAGSTDDPTQSASASSDASTQAPLPQNVGSTVPVQAPLPTDSASGENSIVDDIETGWDFAKYWLDPETDVLGTAVEYYEPKPGEATSTIALKVAGFGTAVTVFAPGTTIAVGAVAAVEELKHYPHNMATLTSGMASAKQVMTSIADQPLNPQPQAAPVSNATQPGLAPSPSPTPAASNPGPNQ